jgi:two-component system OmpR family sensor kinase
MTLRTRLLLVLIGVVAAGLIISDAVTYTQLRSFLFARLDPQLEVASFTMARALEATNGIGPALPFAPDASAPGNHAGSSGPGGAGGSTGTRPTFAPLPSIPRRFDLSGTGLEPAGTIGELVSASGTKYGKSVSVVYSGAAPGPPILPHPLPTVSAEGYTVFSVSGSGPHAVSYRAIERPLHFHQLREVVAIPLSDVDDTLGRLLLIELLVSGVVLAALALLARWIVGRGLRPLDDMATVAGEIAGGELGRRVSPSDDHTEVGRLGLALNSMLGEIEEAFRVRAASEDRLRRFLADASHELRTPLTSIRGYAELFDLGAKTNPADLATSMRHIREEAVRMGVLVDDLLLLARADRERPLDLTPVDIVPVVQKAVAAAQLTTEAHRIALDAPASLVAPCDLDRLRQVVDNLVVNALHHSPDHAPVEVTLRPDGDDALLLVRDHGEGVDEQDVDLIFEPFHRADFARARAQGGAGLGLAIVAAIARAHGGAVGVGRAEGGGAEFWVRLPAMRGASAPGGGSSANTGIGTGTEAGGAPPESHVAQSSGNSQESQSAGTAGVD